MSVKSIEELDREQLKELMSQQWDIVKTILGFFTLALGGLSTLALIEVPKRPAYYDTLFLAVLLFGFIMAGALAFRIRVWKLYYIYYKNSNPLPR